MAAFFSTANTEFSEIILQFPLTVNMKLTHHPTVDKHWTFIKKKKKKHLLLKFK